MGNHELHIFSSQAVPVEESLANVIHLPHGVFEDLLTFLLYKMQALLHRLRTGRHPAASCRHFEGVAAGPVDFIEKSKEALAFPGRLNQHRTRAVPEQDARAAVLVIDDPGHGIGAYDEHFFVRPCHDQMSGHGQAVDEAGTRGHQVEAPCSLRSNPVLHQTRRRRKHHVGCNRTDNHGLDLRWCNPPVRQEATRCFHGHIGGSDLGCRNVAFHDSSTIQNPLVVGIDELL